ncbi:DUF6234 family protein [Streptomyces sp. NPDC003717]|uniref:DUF6234 family protein n=1 Tax=Streptomyces sp. NPDC003717 TaxID=3154276 RepID=UPI0033B24885
MDLPVAPPAFDATSGPRSWRRADRGADVGAGCGLVVLESVALVVIFGLWFRSGFDLDPAETAVTDSLWGYLAAAAGVGVFALVAAAVAAWNGAVATVVRQAVVLTVIGVVLFGGAEVQSHEDQRCRDLPSAAGCQERGR